MNDNEKIISTLLAKIAELERRLSKNSSNSSKQIYDAILEHALA